MGGGRRQQWRACVSPVDVMAHARDESGQEHERVPVRRFSARHAAHVAVGAAVTLREQPGNTHLRPAPSTTHTFGATSACSAAPPTPPPAGAPMTALTHSRKPQRLIPSVRAALG